MKFMVYATRTGAENRSRAEAQRRGCGPSSVTQLWWDVVEGTDGSFACVIKDVEDEENMSSTDRNRLSTTFQQRFDTPQGRPSR